MFFRTAYNCLPQKFHSGLLQKSRQYWTQKQITKSYDTNCAINIAEILSTQQTITDVKFYYSCFIKNPNLINPENYLINSIYEVEINYIKNNIPLKRSYSSNDLEQVKQELTKFIKDNVVHIDINKLPLDL